MPKGFQTLLFSDLQKFIEEAPSPRFPNMRQGVCEATVNLARAAHDTS